MRTPLDLLLGLALAAGLPAIESAAQTAKYPDRPIKMMVGFTAGGGTDVVARILAQKMSESIGQTVFVENRPGASGLLAVEAVAKSPPDGYTLLMGTQTTYAVAPTLYRKTSIDPVRDFAGISMSAISPLVLVVHPSVPAQSVNDVIAMAKAKAGTLNFGSGEAPAINDLLGGQIPLMFANLSAVIGNVRAGQLRALAVTSAQRAPAAPEIPTVAESGLPGFETSTWFALVAPAGTPHEVLARLNAEVKRALGLGDVKQRFASLGMTAEDSTPEGLDAYIKSEIATWTKVIRDADIKAVE
jgi:tripartite-type tricarboxylate transporter receptor subunit TctC